MEWSARQDSTLPWSMAKGLKWTVLVVKLRCRVKSSETWVNCRDPNHHVITAGGREPLDTQVTSVSRPTDNGLLRLVIRAVKGRTASSKTWKQKERKEDEHEVTYDRQGNKWLIERGITWRLSFNSSTKCLQKEMSNKRANLSLESKSHLQNKSHDDTKSG